MNEAERKRPRWWGNLSVVALLVMLPGGIVATTHYRPLTNDVQGACLGAGIALTVICFATVYLLGRAGLHPYKTRSFVNFGSLAGPFALGIGFVALVNGACDPHPVEEHEVRVLRVPHGSGNVSGETVEDWRAGHEGGDIKLPWLPDDVRPGDPVVVVVGPGLVGYWFEDVRRAESANP